MNILGESLSQAWQSTIMITMKAPKNNFYLWLACLLFILALFLRVQGLQRSLWYDELFSKVHFMGGSLIDSLWTYRAANNHPLYSFFANLSARFFDGPAALRYPALLFGLAMFPCCFYFLSRLPVEKSVVLITAALLAISPAHVLYSNEARGYSGASLAAFLIMLAPALPRSRRPGRAVSRRSVLFGAAIVLGLWIHPATALVSVAVSLSLCFETPCRFKWPLALSQEQKIFLGVSVMAHALVFAIYLKILKRMVSFAKRNVLAELSFRPGQYFSGVVGTVSSWDHVSWLSGLVCGLACVGLVKGWRDSGHLQRFARHFLLTLGLSSVFWLLPGTLYFPRFSLVLIGPFCFFAAYGLHGIAKAFKYPLLVISFALGFIAVGQIPTCWAWGREALQDYRGGLALGKKWQVQSGGVIVSGGLGAELFSVYGAAEIPVINKGKELDERLKLCDVIYLEAFENRSVGPVKARLKKAREMARLVGLRESVRVYWLTKSP
jgi:hypothetical protein